MEFIPTTLLAPAATPLAAPQAASLPAMAAETVARHADAVAFTAVMPNGMYGDLRYREVGERSDDFAAYLRLVLRLQPGDRVAVLLPNGLAWPVVLLGILKAGCVAVNTNPLYTVSEMEHQFADSGVAAVVAVDMFADKVQAVLPRCPQLRHVVLARVAEFFPAPVGAIVQGIQTWWNRVIPRHTMQAAQRLPAALAAGRAARGGTQVRDWWQALGHDDLALLQYTGGTTGAAKGAMLTHGNLLWNMAQLRATVGERLEPGREVVLTALPLYHIFAFTVNFLAMFEAGARNVLVPSPRPVQNLQRAFDNYRITWMTGVNTLYNALLAEEWFTVFPPKHLKVAGGGGAAMHAAVVGRFEAMTGAPLLEGYGLTEASPVVCFQPPAGPRKRDSIGLPVPATEVRLVADDGRDVPDGEPGELLVRGPQVMRGYWQRPDETAAVLRDGWLHTGDVAVRDADGSLRIVDRKKDLILVSGFNVYPNEVEEALARHDMVLEAGVAGMPDATTGEAVHAWVVRRDRRLTEAELLAHCRTVLAAYKLPRRIVFCDELPKTTVGKILRRELRHVQPAATAAQGD